MLEPEDRPPQIARVMKVVSPNSPTTASTEKVAKYEDDYADSTSDSVTDEQLASEDEWNVVSSKKSECGRRGGDMALPVVAKHITIQAF
jgi:hypothetical protein